MHKTSEEWLLAEDKSCFSQRTDRLEWLISKAPAAQIWTFPGGWLAKQLFEEARYCFVYGQFLAAAILGFAFLERTFAAIFYGAGRNDLRQATSKDLLQEANAAGWLTEQELSAFDKARRLRNLLVHFKKPGYADSIEVRAVHEERNLYEIVEDDASHILEVVFRVLARNTVG